MNVSLYDRVRAFITAGQAFDLYECSQDIEENEVVAKEYEDGFRKGIRDLLLRRDIQTLSVLYNSPLKDGLSALWMDEEIEAFTFGTLTPPKKENIRYLIGLSGWLTDSSASIKNGINQAFRTSINMGDRHNASILATLILIEDGIANFIDFASSHRTPGKVSPFAFTESEHALSAAFKAALYNLHAKQETETISATIRKSLKTPVIWFCLPEATPLIEYLELYLDKNLQAELAVTRSHPVLRNIFRQSHEPETSGLLRPLSSARLCLS